MSAALPKQHRRITTQQRRLLLGLLFISPWLIAFLTFTVYPLASSLYYSFTRYDLLNEPVFLGLRNYVDIFTEDPHFGQVLYNTGYYVGLSAPLGVVAAFLMATLLDTKIVGRSAFRASFFFPAVVPAIVTAMVWRFLLNVQFGAINPQLAKPSLILIHMWAQGNAIVIFLASLQDVPPSLYDAATVDGANAWHKFRHVTLPMCTPVILFNLIMGFIGGFQNFTFPWLLTSGGPNRATEFYSIYLYRNAFSYFRMGKASALAWILFVIVVTFTIVLFRTSARWVYYGGSDK